MSLVFHGDSRRMKELDEESVHLIITSPPYFNIKDYSGKSIEGQIGDFDDYHRFHCELLKVWQECERVLKPNGKLCVVSPLMPMLKSDMNTHYNRDILNIDGDIEYQIKSEAGLFLYDKYIWNRPYSSQMMFGSYPKPGNLYSKNTSEFITIFVKDGEPEKRDAEAVKASLLTKEEWVEYTSHIWTIQAPPISDRKTHPATFPIELPRRLIKMFSFVGDVVLDPFAGSGTALKAAQDLQRDCIGYEINPEYLPLIKKKLQQRTMEGLN